ncbi:MAG: DUF3080 family protein [Oleiphilaceae bacterium]|nr:DUF3080 family protein [Oleiphilaceae bacterium]
MKALSRLGLTPLVALAMALALSACSLGDESTQRMDQYLQRLSGLLEQPLVPSPVATVEALPRRRERVLEMPELDMGLVDFLSLYGCDLQVVVGERTSSLGRVMHPGTRLEYEVRFISAAGRCLPSIDNERRAEALKEALESKKDSLPTAIWNATWGSEELASFLSRSQGTLPQDMPPQTLQEARQSLVTMTEAVASLAGDSRPDELEPLHGVYQRWQSGATAGKLLRSAELMAARLEDGAGMMEKRLRDPLCPDGQPAGLADGARDLYNGYYAERVRPYLELLQQARELLLPPLQQLMARQRVAIPPGMEDFLTRNIREGEGSVWQSLDRASLRHHQAWQALLVPCGANGNEEDADKASR